ncbi:MAG: hypothetical protein COB51_05925 [Moraxellaceae bacterium]|nr:MAG: hypothetical protein COB51_05925 [Moraxellaceae bacterium]
MLFDVDLGAKPGEEVMSCIYKLSKSEVIKAMQLHCKGTRRTIKAASILGGMLLLIGYFTEYKTFGYGSAVGGFLGYFAVLFLLIPINASRRFDVHRTLNAEISFFISEQGIRFKSEVGENKLQWSDIRKWRYGKGMYLFYINNSMFHMIPSRVLSDDNELCYFLNKYAGPQKV